MSGAFMWQPSALGRVRSKRLPTFASRTMGFELTNRRTAMDRDQTIAAIRKDWKTNTRWQGINRPYSPEDVYRLRGTVKIEYSLAQRGAGKLWTLLHEEPFVNSL